MTSVLKIIIPAIVIIIIASVSLYSLSTGLDHSFQDEKQPIQSTDESIIPNPENESSKPKINTSVKINDPGYIEGEIVYDVLHKDIPPGYIFGNYHDNNLDSGMTGTRLENSKQMASIRFTAQHAGAIEKLQLSLSSSEDYEIVIGFQKDDGQGNPSGNWISEDAVSLHVTNSTIPFEVFTFEKPISLNKGQVYHIIVKLQDGVVNEDPIYQRTFHSTIPGRPLNFEDPDIYAQDDAISSLWFDGENWVDLERWPLFILTYSDGMMEGQPYTLAAPWSIEDTTKVGQSIIPASDYNVSKIAFLVSKKGNITEPLLYEIRNSDNIILREGIFAQPDEVGLWKTWIEVTLDNPILMKAGQTYRVVIFSNIPDSLDNIYRLYGHEFNPVDELGYGGIRHTLTISHNFGESWASWNDADAIFRFTTSD